MFDYILEILRLNFKEVQSSKKNYFINENNEIVATMGKNIITMYYKVDGGTIWNHSGFAVVAIAKDFCFDNKKTGNSFIADAMLIKGLCGSCNDAELIGNYFLDTAFNMDYSSANLYPQNFGACGNLYRIGNIVNLDICGQL